MTAAKLDPELRAAVRAAATEELTRIAGRQMCASMVIHVDSILRISSDIADRVRPPVRLVLTADEVRSAVREAFGDYPYRPRVEETATRVAEKLAGDSLAGIGHERAAIIDQALVYWDRDLTAPHAQIAEIRKMIGGGS